MDIEAGHTDVRQFPVSHTVQLAYGSIEPHLNQIGILVGPPQGDETLNE